FSPSASIFCRSALENGERSSRTRLSGFSLCGSVISPAAVGDRSFPVGGQAGGLDPSDDAFLVIVPAIATGARRSDNFAARVADQHAARACQHPSVGKVRDGAEKGGVSLEALDQPSRGEAHPEAAPGLACGDLRPQEGRLVLALEGD